jgi:hypothetical protein
MVFFFDDVVTCAGALLESCAHQHRDADQLLWMSAESVLLAANRVLNRKFAPLVDDGRRATLSAARAGGEELLTRSARPRRLAVPCNGNQNMR